MKRGAAYLRRLGLRLTAMDTNRNLWVPSTPNETWVLGNDTGEPRNEEGITASKRQSLSPLTICVLIVQNWNCCKPLNQRREQI